MTLSRLQAGKRVNLAIDALAEVVKSHPEAKLVAVGYGEEKRNLEEQVCALGLEKHVIFTGRISHELVYDYLQRADVFLSLYSASNLGNPLFEAMRCGKAIITVEMCIRDSLRIIGSLLAAHFPDDLFIAGKLDIPAQQDIAEP